MRTVVTYFDKENKRTTKENAWTVMTQVFNDAGNLQRTGYSIGEAQEKASQRSNVAAQLVLREELSGEVFRFSNPLLKAGRDTNCDIVFGQKEDKKKIDKVHASFELRQGKWHVMDLSKAGTWLNEQRLKQNVPTEIKKGDIINLGNTRMLHVE